MKRKPGGQVKEDKRVGLTITLKESVIAKLGKDAIRKEAHRYFEQIKQLSDEEIEKTANDSGAYRVEAGWFIEGFKKAIELIKVGAK